MQGRRMGRLCSVVSSGLWGMGVVVAGSRSIVVR